MVEMIHPTITIAHEELADSPKETFTPEGLQATRELKCAWADRFELMRQLMGGVDAQGVYHLPAQYPHYAGAYVQDVKVRPFGTVSMHDSEVNKASHSDAILTVTYGPPIYEFSDQGPLVTERVVPAGSSGVVDTRGLIWSSDDSRVERVTPALALMSFEYHVTYHQQKSLPTGWQDRIGKINSDAINALTLALTFEPEQLLFLTPDIKRVHAVQGGDLWEITFKLMYRNGVAGENGGENVGWQNFWHDGKWDRLKRESDEQEVEIYDSIAFLPVLKQLG